MAEENTMRFAANVSILFREVPFVERFRCAAEAGFRAVEFWWPRGEDLTSVEHAIRDADLTVALFNFDAGDMPAGDRGLVSDPKRQHEFRENVPVALELARKLGVRRLNSLVGHRIPNLRYEEQLALAGESIAWAADQARKFGVDVLIEAVNTFENGAYLLCRTEEVAGFVQAVGRQNVKLQYDVYHMQRMEGNLVATLRKYAGQIGHIQIADSPGRNEPGTGEVNYRYVLDAIDQLGYSGYVGLEYNPTGGNTLASLAWLPRELRGGEVRAADLAL